jgi:hypothetical protein
LALHSGECQRILTAFAAVAQPPRHQSVTKLADAAGILGRSRPRRLELRRRGRALHQAIQANEAQWRAAADALRATTREAIGVFAQHDFGEADLRALLDALVQEGERGEYIDYVAAEQTTMAISSILSTMLDAGLIAQAEHDRIEQVMAELYSAVERDEQYRPSAHLGALRRLQSAAR